LPGGRYSRQDFSTAIKRGLTIVLARSRVGCDPQKLDPRLAGLRMESRQEIVESEVAHLVPVVLILSRGPDRREPLSSKAAGAVPGAQSETAENDAANPDGDGCASPILRLETRAGGGSAGDVRQMASNCLPDIMALEVVQRWPSAFAEESQRTDP
jgi:hypothetical protein